MGGFRAKVLGLKLKALGLGFRVQRCVEGLKVAYHPSLILAWGGVRAWANMFKAIFGISMGYMLRGSQNGPVDMRGPPSQLLWKSLDLGYMSRV